MKPDEIKHTIHQLEGRIEEAELSEEFFIALKKYRGEDRVLSVKKVAEELANEKTPAWQIKTGLPTLDNLIEGFRAGDLVVVSAPTSEGKTKLLETFTWHLSDKEEKALWFTYEIPVRELLERFGENPPRFYLPRKMKSSSLEWIETRVCEAIEKYEIKAVMIDHLHYLFDLAQVKNTSLELGLIVRLLKKMALQHEIVIFLIAHTTKTSPYEELSLKSIRDSSFIGQESDYVIMLSRERVNEGGRIYGDQTKISVQKNRRTGKTGTLKVVLKNKKFEEISNNYD